MKKKAITVVLATSIAFTTALSLNAQNAPVCTPKNTTIAFDIDHVLIGPNPAQWQIIWHNVYPLITGLFNLPLVYNLIQCWWHDAPTDDYIQTFKNAQRNDLALLVERLIEIRTPIEGTVAIARQLKNAGYTLHIATNQSRAIFAINQKAHPQLFTLFSTIKCAQYHPVVIKKPNSNYYQQLRKKIPANQQIIFIDDKLENIIGARKAGFTALLFVNAEVLQADLEKLNLTGFSSNYA